MTFGINVHAHPYCACVFLTDSIIVSAIRTNCDSNGALLQVKLSTDGTSTFAPPMVFHSHIKKGKFSSK